MSTYLETWPQKKIHSIQVRIQTWHPSLDHDQLMRIVDPDDQKQSHNIMHVLHKGKRSCLAAEEVMHSVSDNGIQHSLSGEISCDSYILTC